MLYESVFYFIVVLYIYFGSWLKEQYEYFQVNKASWTV